MSRAAGQIAFDIDEAEGIATIVYLGMVTDQMAHDFYLAGHVDAGVVAGLDFLVDMRHTHWQPSADTIATIAAYVRQVRSRAGADAAPLRIASVRADNTDVHSILHGAPMRTGFGEETMRYFDNMDEARAWLKQSRQA
jgi:hypothetical protein